MRRTSPTNSHKTIDIPFRRAYCEEAQFDELLHYTGWRITEKGLLKEWPGQIEQPRDGVPFDPHHIGHRGAKRDYRTNLIYIPRRVHDLIHFGTRGQPAYGPLLCIYAKLLKAEKTQSPDEFDIELLDECFGQSVLGYIECAQLPPELEWMRDEAVGRITKLEGR